MLRKLISLCLLLIGLSLFLSTIVYAASVDLPSGVKGLRGVIGRYYQGEEWIENAEIGTGIEFDYINQRKLEKHSAKIEGFVLSGRLFCSFVDTVDIYGFFGEAFDAKYKANISGVGVEFEMEDKFMGGGGLSAILHEWEGIYHTVILFGDAKCRTITGMDYESVSVDGVKYKKDQLGGKMNAKWKEWQVALGVSCRFEESPYIPYAGVKYSDLSASAKATIGGTTYDLGSASSDNKIGLFIGLSAVPTERFSIDCEARFIDEVGFTLKGIYKF